MSKLGDECGMSSEDRHRGKHPEDGELFSAVAVPALQQGVHDLSWLLERGYARASALKLVGDRYALRERQRLAVGRAACSDNAWLARKQREVTADMTRGRAVMLDGFNILVSLEAALSGGILLRCRDGCMRDMSSVHGSYHTVAETDAALLAVGQRLQELEVSSAHWLLDKPISNSGRLAQRIREVGEQQGWPWTVETVFNPDSTLIAAPAVVVISSDAMVVEGSQCWFNLVADLVCRLPEPRAPFIDFYTELPEPRSTAQVGT